MDKSWLVVPDLLLDTDPSCSDVLVVAELLLHIGEPCSVAVLLCPDIHESCSAMDMTAGAMGCSKSRDVVVES